MARRRYLVTYDVREPARLRKVFKTVKAYGEPLQYSVFLCDLDGMEKTRMVGEISTVMKHTEDSVAIVDLGEARERGSLCFEFLGTRRSLPGAPLPVV